MAFATSRPQCEVVDCARQSINSTTKLCPMHWHRKYRHGTLGADHDTVGVTESGFGLFGIVTRGKDFVLCHECGKTFKNLGSHLRFTHSMSSEDYRDRHGLASNDQLMCEDQLASLKDISTARIGSPSWERFTKRRDETHGETIAQATAVARRAGAKKGNALNGQKNAPTARQWTCVQCGKPTLSGRRTCGEECTQTLRKIGLAKRDARRLSEEENFTRRTGRGKKLHFEDLLDALSLTDGALRTRIRRGQFPPHAGRENWFAFWWESDIRGRKIS